MMKKDITADALIELFLDSHFKEAYRLLEAQKMFCEQCAIEPCDTEYAKLKRFFSTAVRHLRDIDESCFSKTFAKLYQDATALSDFATKFTMQNTLVSQIFERSFVNTLEAYGIQNSKELENSFSTAFVAKRNEISKNINLFSNVKFFALDKLLWFEASKSEKIRKFFETSAIEGFFDSATLVKYYLRNGDTGQSQKEERTQYLKDILKILR